MRWFCRWMESRSSRRSDVSPQMYGPLVDWTVFWLQHTSMPRQTLRNCTITELEMVDEMLLLRKIFSVHSKTPKDMLDLRTNFKIGSPDTTCRRFEGEEETQEHLFLCPALSSTSPVHGTPLYCGMRANTETSRSSARAGGRLRLRLLLKRLDSNLV